MGIVSNIERYALNDGVGIRTTIFLKGCPLRCKWCCNPETQQFQKELMYFQDGCIACELCVDDCPYGALKNSPVPEREICLECYKRENSFACVRRCYSGCRKVSGEEQTADSIVDIVKRDMQFYLRSGGGVTLSGGEPLAQPEFLLELLKKLKENWINTAIETCGMGQGKDYEKILPYTNMIFYDLKCMDGEKHKEWTGKDNETIKENLQLIAGLTEKYSTELVVRVPVIPGFNDTEKEIRAICEFIKQIGSGISGMELLPYHKLGRGKYKSLGREYLLEGLQPPKENLMETLHKIVDSYKISSFKF
nr:glycyl-radical enzyme activating protein [uncultured Lachnoclostridium sp.]